jgi:hypothetical protein
MKIIKEQRLNTSCRKKLIYVETRQTAREATKAA